MGSLIKTSIQLGVVGVGTIARCVVEGWCKAFIAGEKPAEIKDKILISKRGTQNSQYLLDQYPQVIEIDEDNSSIVERSNLVVLAVRPEHAKEVCSALKFREDHIVLNFISGILSEKDALTMIEPASMVRVCPWPCAKLRIGPVMVLRSPSELITNLFSLVGDVTHVETMEQFITVCASSCVMASFYNALETTTVWLERHNIDRPVGSKFLGSLIHALATDAKLQGEKGFAEITADSQTPGGLNQQVLTSLKESKAFEAIESALDGIVTRQKQ